MREHGVFVHAPDGYLFEGGANKECGGYQEMQENLPRWQSLSINRQIVYDETFLETPTQAWQFAPLTTYHGGGGVVPLEPFSEHFKCWEWTLATYLGTGYGTCYRGSRLYDTPEVQAMVTKWMGFWSKYRTILTADIIHVKRPDGQQIDALLHVDYNRSASVAGLLMVYNPAFDGGNSTTMLKVPLYYTGETDIVILQHEGEGEGEGDSGDGNGEAEAGVGVVGSIARVGSELRTLDRDFSITINVTLPPLGITYYVISRRQTT